MFLARTIRSASASPTRTMPHLVPTLFVPQFILPGDIAPSRKTAPGGLSWAPPHIRWATHKASRAANGAKDGPGKRLGAKKTAGERVRIGQIIYRQRGTLWFPGENAEIGRDHTIYAIEPGFVRYYKDPSQPKRKFIGVALKAEHKLPTPKNAARRRSLGREEVDLIKIQKRDTLDKGELETLRSGIYYYRPPNWKLGLVQKPVSNPFDKKNTWARWQKRERRVRIAKMLKALGTGKSKKTKAKKRR